MIVLRTERLTVEMAEPEEAPAAQTRFDTSAFIRQVTLDRIHTFCTEEPVRPDLPCTMGAGLCSEIVWPVASEFLAGSWFPKFGVGLLKNPDGEEYSFRRRYEHRIFPVSYLAGRDYAVFETDSGNVEGYRLRKVKRAAVKGNTLTVFYDFYNMGEKALFLREYCHNFINIDQRPAGKEYNLKMHVKDQEGKCPERGKGTIYGKGNGFTYSGYTDEPCAVRVGKDEILEGDFYWHLTHTESPASIKESGSFQPERILIWTLGCSISPEISNCFLLQPGETYSYWRKWEFFNKDRGDIRSLHSAETGREQEAQPWQL